MQPRQNATIVQRLTGVLSTPYEAWIPIPSLSRHFWNTNILDDLFVIKAVLGLFLLVWLILLLLRRPVALGLFLSGATGLLVFEWIFRGNARHHGHLFMLLICAYWIAAITPAGKFLEKQSGIFEQLRPGTLIGLLILNAVAGVGAMFAGMVLPFSASWKVAQFIKEEVQAQVTLMGIDDYCVSPIAQYLDQDIYFPQEGRFARYNTQDSAARNVSLEGLTLAQKAFEFIQERGGVVIFLLSHPGTLNTEGKPLPIQTPPGERQRYLIIKPLPEFLDSVVADEGMRLYLIAVAEVNENATKR